MAEKYRLSSQKNVIKVRDILANGMETGNDSYDTYFFIGHEDGERTYLTRDGETKIIVDCPSRKNLVIASKENNDQTRENRNNLVKLLRKHTGISIRKERK